MNQAIFESLRASKDIEPSADPSIPFWLSAGAVFADRGPNGEILSRFRTEIRSCWTNENLYFLFICPYAELNLNPSPNTTSETFELWKWDVAEVFIGADFENINRYKEFEISPLGEWVDLDVDLSNPKFEEGWRWESGFRLQARIDPLYKLWYGAMRIPFRSIVDGTIGNGTEFRINLFWCQPKGARIAWQPPLCNTFHMPNRFGLLRLTERSR